MEGDLELRDEFGEPKTAEEENVELLGKLKAAGVSFNINKRKSTIEQNISLWQALAANQLCAPGTYGEHASKALGLD